MMPDPKFDQDPEDVSEDLPEVEDEDLPGFQQADWDEIQSGVLTREDLTIEELENPEEEGELPGEDDDNPYMDSDEALPDDEEERAIRRDLSEEGEAFDEI